jgi:hypothetical protein
LKLNDGMARLQVIASFFLWIAVLTCGRLIAYV